MKINTAIETTVINGMKVPLNLHPRELTNRPSGNRIRGGAKSMMSSQRFVSCRICWGGILNLRWVLRHSVQYTLVRSGVFKGRGVDASLHELITKQEIGACGEVSKYAPHPTSHMYLVHVHSTRYEVPRRIHRVRSISYEVLLCTVSTLCT